MEPMRNAVVITVSDRCATGLAQDVSGPAAATALAEAGFTVTTDLVPDGVDSVASALRRAVETGARLVVTSGGTGLAPRDLTPEGTRQVIDREVPGLAELIRAHGVTKTPYAALSRGLAGLVDSHGALVINLPGSPKAVREGLDVVVPLLDHVLAQLAGGDH